MKALPDAQLGRVNPLIGSIIPQANNAAFYDVGIAAIFGPGASREDIVASFEKPTQETREKKTNI